MKKLVKLKKPKLNDPCDMPQFNFENIQPLAFQDAFELISRLVKYHKEAGIHQSNLPLMYNEKGQLEPLAGRGTPPLVTSNPGKGNASHFKKPLGGQTRLSCEVFST